MTQPAQPCRSQRIKFRFLVVVCRWPSDLKPFPFFLSALSARPRRQRHLRSQHFTTTVLFYIRVQTTTQAAAHYTHTHTHTPSLPPSPFFFLSSLLSSCFPDPLRLHRVAFHSRVVSIPIWSQHTHTQHTHTHRGEVPLLNLGQGSPPPLSFLPSILAAEVTGAAESVTHPRSSSSSSPSQ